MRASHDDAAASTMSVFERLYNTARLRGESARLVLESKRLASEATHARRSLSPTPSRSANATPRSASPVASAPSTATRPRDDGRPPLDDFVIAVDALSGPMMGLPGAPRVTGDDAARASKGAPMPLVALAKPPAHAAESANILQRSQWGLSATDRRMRQIASDTKKMRSMWEADVASELSKAIAAESARRHGAKVAAVADADATVAELSLLDVEFSPSPRGGARAARAASPVSTPRGGSPVSTPRSERPAIARPAPVRVPLSPQTGSANPAARFEPLRGVGGAINVQ